MLVYQRVGVSYPKISFGSFGLKKGVRVLRLQVTWEMDSEIYLRENKPPAWKGAGRNNGDCDYPSAKKKHHKELEKDPLWLKVPM